jgi:hypothetical protein
MAALILLSCYYSHDLIVQLMQRSVFLDKTLRSLLKVTFSELHGIVSQKATACHDHHCENLKFYIIHTLPPLFKMILMASTVKVIFTVPRVRNNYTLAETLLTKFSRRYPFAVDIVHLTLQDKRLSS